MPDHRLARKFLHCIWDAQIAALPDGTDPSSLHAYLAQKAADATWSDKPLTVTSDGVTLRLPRESDNLYYAINLFTEQRRIKRFVSGGCWLYADLDEVDPRQIPDDLQPTLAIESSPGRYQALWLLTRWLNTRRLAELNQQLTYYLGADKGNWKMTQVLRVPGTVSTKHDAPYEVTLLWSRTRTQRYTPNSIRALVGDVETPQTLAAARELTLPSASAARLVRRHAASLPARTKKLLRTKTVLGSEDRSARLWELECSLLEAGMTPEETMKVVRTTVWNKWRDHDDQLWTEVQKAAARVTSKVSPTPPRKKKRQLSIEELADSPPDEVPLVKLPFLPLHKFMARDHTEPGWLVEDVWVDGAYGWWAGEYKAFKTMTLLDFAVSIASGKPFLGQYEVCREGRVMYLYEEGQRRAIQTRLNNILVSRGLGGHFHSNGNGMIKARFPSTFPLDIFERQLFREVTGSSFNLGDAVCQRSLDDYVETHKPTLIILEAFYLVTGGIDESSAQEVIPILKYLEGLNNRHPKTNIVISHHYNKSTEERSRSTSRISGSGALLRWYESAVELERTGEEEDLTVHFKATHRDAQPMKKVTLQFTFEGHDSYDVQVLDADAAIDLDTPPAEIEIIREILAEFPEGITITELEKQTNFNRQMLRRKCKVHKIPTKTEVRDKRRQLVIYPSKRPKTR